MIILWFCSYCSLKAVAVFDQPAPQNRLDSLEEALRRIRTFSISDEERDTAQVSILLELVKESSNTSPKRTKDFAHEALQLARRIGFQSGIAHATLCLGTAAWQHNLYDEALRYYVEAARLYEEQRMSSDLARAYTHIGNVHLRTAHYLQALEYYNRSLLIARELRDTDRIATNLGVCAQVYRMQWKQYDRAIDTLQESLRLFTIIGNKLRIAITTNILGTVYDNKGEHETALTYHRKAFRLLQELGNRNTSIIETQIDIATSLNALKRFDEALPYTQEAVKRALSLNARHIAMYGYSTLAQSYEGLHRYEEAYRAALAAGECKDTVFTMERSQAIADMQARYDVDIKDAQLQKQQVELGKQALVRNLWIIGALLSLVALAWVIMLFRAKLRAEKNLSSANESLRQSNEELSRLDEEKDEFIGIIVHDLKNPLSSIRLAAEMISLIWNSPRQQRIPEYAATIQSTVRQMLEIITHLLDVNKLERGLWTMTIEPVSLDEITVLVEQYKLQALAKNITFSFETHCSSTTKMYADRIALQHVADNLFSNALKYSPFNTQILIRCSSGISSDAERRIVRLEVQDEGPGISEEDMKRLFGKFARLSAQPTNSEHSTGLGLSITKKLVELMNGKIWCESRVGFGARFIVELPAYTADED